MHVRRADGAAMLLAPFVAVALAATPPNFAFMDCGTAPLCGVLTLETGYGAGPYQHSEPVLHGLWPQVEQYGSSACALPANSVPPAELASCYASTDSSAARALAFEQYEWKKHGVCAGSRDASDYLQQTCALAQQPLRAMAEDRRNGLGLDEMAEGLRGRGFPVHVVDRRNAQIELSACAGADGRWKLAAVEEMGRACGGTSGTLRTVVPPPAAGGTPEVTPAACLPSRRGPSCAATGEGACIDVPGCVRCAKSGFCTDVPLPSSPLAAAGPRPDGGTANVMRLRGGSTASSCQLRLHVRPPPARALVGLMATTSNATVPLQDVPAPPPGAFHPGWVCAVKRGLIVGYRYARPSTAGERQEAADAGYTPMAMYSICQEAFDELGEEEQLAYERIAPPIDPAKLAAGAFATALLLGAAGGLASTGRFLDGGDGSLLWRALAEGGVGGGADPYDLLREDYTAPTLSWGEQAVAAIFGLNVT